MSIETFSAYKELQQGVDGYFSDLAAAISDCLLHVQGAQRYRGNMMEIGAWHGMSASMWALHLAQSETLTIVDIEVRPELAAHRDKLNAASAGTVALIKGSSYSVLDDRFVMEARQSYRLVHIDGDHSTWGISVDLQKVARIVNINGLIIVDDFLNDRFPQVTEETYKFLRLHDGMFQLVASGANKAFIVTTKRYPVYAAYAREHLITDLAARGIKARLFDGESLGRYVAAIRPA
jgi:hypothetical protein